LQGPYTTAFALATTPVLQNTTSLRQQVAKMGMKWKDFCTVDNACFGEKGL